MSLDGYMNDPSGDVGRLYPDLAELRRTQMLQDSIARTGAAVMGRHTYDMAQGDLTDYEFQVPIFVITHAAPDQAPKGQNDKLQVHFVTDGIESAIAQAKAAAGDNDVTFVGGADTAQQLLRAGLVDELEIGIVPVLLGGGLRFFKHLGIEPLSFEIIEVLESPGRVDIRMSLKH